MLTKVTTLPTVEEAREFLRLVNKGRTAIGLEPLAKLDYDRAQPGVSTNCLSARNLFAPAGILVFHDVVDLPERENERTRAVSLLGAIGSALLLDTDGATIPDAIRRVTDPFDDRAPGLRDRLVAAGVVAP